MALKAKVANKVVTTESGLVEGTIVQVLEIEERIEIEKVKGKDKEVKYRAQFEFHIESEGSQKSITYRLWTGQSFNNEKLREKDKVQDYNDFTRLMLQLEVISESDLKDLQNPKLTDFDVESVEGLKILFELEPSKKAKSNGLKVPKLTTIKPLKASK